MQKNKTARRVSAEEHHIGIAKEGAKGINDGRVQQGQRLPKKKTEQQRSAQRQRGISIVTLHSSLLLLHAADEDTGELQFRASGWGAGTRDMYRGKMGWEVD
jgi:hypothetical protein